MQHKFVCLQTSTLNNVTDNTVIAGNAYVALVWMTAPPGWVNFDVVMQGDLNNGNVYRLTNLLIAIVS